MPSLTLPFMLPEERSINIDNPIDVLLLEALLSRGDIELEEYD